MFPCLAGYGYWWAFPVIMIALMVLCFFMMRGHAGPMRRVTAFGGSVSRSESASDRPPDALIRKHARGEIAKPE